MPNFTIEEQFRKKPVREQQPQKISLPPLTHRYNPPHIFKQNKKIPPNVSLKR